MFLQALLYNNSDKQNFTNVSVLFANIVTNERDRQSLLWHFTASEDYVRDLSQIYKQMSEKYQASFNIFNANAGYISVTTQNSNKQTHLI